MLSSTHSLASLASLATLATLTAVGALATFTFASKASAQRQVTEVTLSSGSGLTLGTGQGAGTTARHTPVFIDGAVRFWTDEQPDYVLGGSVRMELDGRVSVAVVPRAELVTVVGPLTIRPGIGVPFFFAPFWMLGVELGVAARLPLGDNLGVVGSFMLDGYVVGSDVPDGTALIMINGMVGLDARF